MHKQRKFLVYLSVFFSAFLSLPACGSGGLEVASTGALATSTVQSEHLDDRLNSESLSLAQIKWRDAETKNYLEGVKAQKEAARAARKRAEVRRTVHAASVAPQGITAAPRGDVNWDLMASCESGGNWQANTGNGYYGGLQFDLSSWRSAGGTSFAPRPDLASREQQITTAERWRSMHPKGMGAWPTCARKFGYYRG